MAEIEKQMKYNINTVNHKNPVNKKTVKECGGCARRTIGKGPGMKWEKRGLPLLLAALLSFCLSACTQPGGEPQSSGDPSSSDEAFYTVDVYALGTAADPIRAEIEARANEILEEACGAHVRLRYLGSKENCLQQVKLAVSTGEKCDLFPSFEIGVGAMVNNNLILPLNEYLPLCGAEIREDIPAEDWACVTMNGKICGVPINREKANGRGFVYRKDLAEELGVDPDSIRTMDDLEALLIKVRDAYPDMYPIVTSTGLARLPLPYDRLGDSLGVLEDSFSDSTRVVNLFETDSYRAMVELQWKWANMGLMMPDGSSNTSNEFALIRAGKGFGHFANVKPDKERETTSGTGYPTAIFQIVPPYSESTLVSSMWNICSTSGNPEKAMLVLNEMYTNPELANLFTYGIEGKTYRVVDREKRLIGRMEDWDIKQNQYSFAIWSWPNELLVDVWEGDPPDIWQRVQRYNSEARPSPARGFVWDDTKVLGQVTACTIVLDRYRDALECGSLDPATALPCMNEELRAAGIDEIVREKQAQLDRWIVQQKTPGAAG